MKKAVRAKKTGSWRNLKGIPSSSYLMTLWHGENKGNKHQSSEESEKEGDASNTAAAYETIGIKQWRSDGEKPMATLRKII